MMMATQGRRQDFHSVKDTLFPSLPLLSFSSSLLPLSPIPSPLSPTSPTIQLRGMWSASNLLSPEGLFLAQNAPKIALPRPSIAGFNGPTSKEGDGRAGRYGEGREGWGDEWRGKGEQGRGGARACPPPKHNFWLRR